MGKREPMWDLYFWLVFFFSAIVSLFYYRCNRNSTCFDWPANFLTNFSSFIFIFFLIPRIWYGQYCGRRCCRLNCARQQFAGRSRVATGGSWSSFNQYNFGGCNTMLMYNWAQFGSPLYICSAVAGRDCVSIKSAEHEEKKNKRGGRGSNQTGKPH